MVDLNPAIHICDDWIHIGLGDRAAVAAAQAALAAGHHWTEIVPGLAGIAVQFDPARISPDDAGQLLSDQLGQVSARQMGSEDLIIIPVCYDRNLAPDHQYVAEKLGVASDSLSSWHTAHIHHVAMLGFMPGFAYLESSEDVADIGRLASPRQLVKAGSIGIIGRQSCIYSFDSPGGWPIIGRTPLRLFDPAKAQPALLSAGQAVRFESISRETFDNWPQAAGE